LKFLSQYGVLGSPQGSVLVSAPQFLWKEGTKTRSEKENMKIHPFQIQSHPSKPPVPEGDLYTVYQESVIERTIEEGGGEDVKDQTIEKEKKDVPCKPSSSASSDTRRTKFWIAAFIASIILIITIVATKASRTESPVEQQGTNAYYEAYKSNLISALNYLYDYNDNDDDETYVAATSSTSPQGMALSWMVRQHFDVASTLPEVLVERYALATIYYASGGEEWANQYHFLSDSLHVCDWHGFQGISGVSCDEETSKVTSLTLSKSTSTICFEMNEDGYTLC
jgi:hypothetical protein